MALHALDLHKRARSMLLKLEPFVMLAELSSRPSDNPSRNEMCELKAQHKPCSWCGANVCYTKINTCRLAPHPYAHHELEAMCPQYFPSMLLASNSLQVFRIPIGRKQKTQETQIETLKHP